MAGKKKVKEYESKLIVSSLRYTSRVAVKIKDNFFTVEACEERVLPDQCNAEEVDWDKERKMLWDQINGDVDEQVQEIRDYFAK